MPQRSCHIRTVPRIACDNPSSTSFLLSNCQLNLILLPSLRRTERARNTNPLHSFPSPALAMSSVVDRPIAPARSSAHRTLRNITSHAEILDRVLRHADNATLVTCLRASKQMFELAGASLYHTVSVAEESLHGFMRGVRCSIKARPQSPGSIEPSALAPIWWPRTSVDPRGNASYLIDGQRRLDGFL